MPVQKIPIEPTYRKPNGLFVITLESAEIPEFFSVKERSIIAIPPGKVGGNHKHPRSEAFVAVSGDLQLVWLDEEGKKHQTRMREDERLFLFIVPSFVPHAVINKGKTDAVFFEFADYKQHDVEAVMLIKED